MSGKTKKELLKEAKKFGIEVDEEMTVVDLKAAIAEAEEVEEEEEEDEEAAPAAAAKPVDADVLVNRDKVEQAKVIVALLTGKRAPKNSNESERQEHYAAVLESREIDPKAKDAVKRVYAEVLLGAVRSPAQDAAHQKKVATMRKSLKRRQIEEKQRADDRAEEE